MRSKQMLKSLVFLWTLAVGSWAGANSEPPAVRAPADSPQVSVAATSEQTLLLKVLRSRQFVELDEYVSRMQRAYEADTTKEKNVVGALWSFHVADPSLTPHFDAWRQARPESYAAFAASGLHYIALASAWRGSQYINRTHPKRIDEMEKHLAIAGDLLNGSLRLTPIPVTSYTALIVIERMAGSRADAEGWLAEAVRRDPSAASPRETFSRMLQPRWGGSHAEMDSFAAAVASAATDEKTRALAKRLALASLADRAHLRWEEKDLAGALRMYEEAAAKSSPDAYADSRGEILLAVGQTASALALFDGILARAPDDLNAHYQRSRALFRLRRNAEALASLRRAAEGGLVSAWTELGSTLVDGEHGVAVDDVEGLYWLGRAAHFWGINASFALGKTYEQGIGVKIDQARAVEYYRRAAEQDHGPSQNDLGLMLWYGRGAAQDQDEAIRLWTIAAKKNIWQAKHNLDFFLSPVQKAKLATEEPLLVYNVPTIIGFASAVLLFAVLLTLIAIRRELKLDQAANANWR